jgi:membrane associated rhomboid family serine protease
MSDPADERAPLRAGQHDGMEPHPPPLPGEPASRAGEADGHGPPPLPAEMAARAEEGEGEEPPPVPRTWMEMFPPRPKLEGVEYGFVNARGEAFRSTPEHLLRMARTRSLPPLVWTPETPGMVPPWEVPFLLQAIRDDASVRARAGLPVAWAGGALSVPAVWLFAPPDLALVLIVALGAVLALVIGSIHRQARQAERMTPEEMRAAFDTLAAQQVEEALPVPFTRALAAAVIVTGITQLVTREASIEAGALRLDAVLAGEAWRLFTAPMLHANILHFWLNYMALESLGRTMETRGVGAWVPIVFLAAALAGGATSLALPPDVASVGASGGLLGMFGFLAVMAYRRKRHLPPGFLRALMINIALIAGLGVLAYRFVDNAAHAGGLIAGALVGFAAVPDGDRVPRWTAGPRLETAGRVAKWMIWLSAAAAIGVALLARFGG